jgi:hypothetical protein
MDNPRKAGAFECADRNRRYADIGDGSRAAGSAHPEGTPGRKSERF